MTEIKFADTKTVPTKERVNVSPEMCMKEDSDSLSPKQLRGCIAGLLGTNVREKDKEEWWDELNARDPENLTVGVDRNKIDHFKFLGSDTKWKTMGKWLNPKTGKIDRDKNYQIEVMFKDNKKEEVGNRLIDLFKEYNEKTVGEDLLFVKTNAVEETTLFD